MAASKAITRRLKWNEIGSVSLTAVDATDGAELQLAGDESSLIILSSTASLSVTLHAGDGPQGTDDLVVALTAGVPQYLAVESGRFVQTHGTDNGKIRITASASGLSAGCLVLPR